MNRALIHLCIALGLLYVIREMEYAGVRKASGGEFEKLNVIFEEENDFDLVVIGSSRAECQYYTPYIDSFCGIRSYNLGMTGATMPFIASTLEAYLVHSKAPKYVVLNLDLHSLGDNNDTVYRFPRYFPFLDNEKLYDGLQEHDGRFVFFRWLPFYSMPYFNNRYLSNAYHGWMETPTQFDTLYEQGFSPSIPDLSWGDYDTATMMVTNAKIPEAVWDAFYRIVDICNENNCKLILAISPIYHRQENAVKEYKNALNDFRTYAQLHEIPFIDLGNHSLKYEQENYNDPEHLNTTGARVFTEDFSFYLRQYLAK